MELKSIAGLFRFNINVVDYNPESPFMVIDLPSEECAKQLMSRTVLVKSICELWAHATNYQQLDAKLSTLPPGVTDPFTSKHSSFRIMVDTFNRRIPWAEKVKKIEALTSGQINFEGSLNLKAPDHSFHLYEFYGAQSTEPPVDPFLIYFGRWIADGRREDIRKYHLQTRKFIGNTSMDAELSLIMANQGKVKKSSFVFDPFVGTGSLLIACAHFGGYVMGTDLDHKIIHGRGKASRRGQKWRGPDDNIRSNLKQYGLEHLYIDALVADAALHHMWRPQPLFDAIITDPPYGIREQTRKVGSKNKEPVIPDPDEQKEVHSPSRVAYKLSDILRDLLNFAATFLRLDGRLVYWVPVYRPDYSDEQLPQHPCLKLVGNSEQVLNTRIGRRLVTMEKVKECEEEHLLQGATFVSEAYSHNSFREMYFKSGNEGSSRSSSRSRSRSSSPALSKDSKKPSLHENKGLSPNSENGKEKVVPSKS